MRSGLVAAALVGLLGIAGVTACSSAPANGAPVVEEAGGADGSATAVVFSKDPCTLLTDQEITAALGKPVAGTSADSLGQPACEWRISGKGGTPDLELSYTDPVFVQHYKELRADPEANGSYWKPIDIADGGLIAERTVRVLVGGGAFEIGSHRKVSAEAVQTLARAAASRLP